VPLLQPGVVRGDAQPAQQFRAHPSDAPGYASDGCRRDGLAVPDATTAPGNGSLITEPAGEATGAPVAIVGRRGADSAQ
jgi:hypothetical protein